MDWLLKGVGVVTLFWVFGGCEFMPKLQADLSQWQGVDTFNQIMQTGGRAIASQLDKKLGNAKPLPADQNVKLGTEICKEGTVTPNARLPQKEYEEHLRSVALKVRSPLRTKNSYMFCELKGNRWALFSGQNKFIYIPGWDAAKGKALLIDGDSTESKVIDLDSDGKPKP